MHVSVVRIHRHSNVPREELAGAVFEWCRAASKVDDAKARFYWIDPNEIGILIHASTQATLNTINGQTDAPLPELAALRLKIADRADLVRIERWVDPVVGARFNELGGR